MRWLLLASNWLACWLAWLTAHLLARKDRGHRPCWLASWLVSRDAGWQGATAGGLLAGKGCRGGKLSLSKIRFIAIPQNFFTHTHLAISKMTTYPSRNTSSPPCVRIAHIPPPTS